MAIVQKFEKPDISLTMACNQNWRVISEGLQEKEKTADFLNIVSQVFHCNLNRMKDDRLDGNEERTLLLIPKPIDTRNH